MAARSQIQRYPASDSTLSMQSVRRNLFNSQLSRRPTRSDSTTSSSRTVIDYPQDQTSNSDSSSEILIKNANGDYAATIPSISFLVTDSNEAAVVDEQCDQLEDDRRCLS